MLFGLIALLALLLQTTVLPLVGGVRATPDLLLILCVYLGLRQHSVGGACAAFLLGYLEDSFSGSSAGLNAFAMTLVFTIVYLTSRRLWVDNTVSKVILVFLASVLKSFVILVLLTVFATVDGAWGSLLGYLLLDAVIVGIVSPPVFALLGRSRRFAEAEED